MARRKVLFLSNNYYHVYNRGAHQENIFRDEDDYLSLLKFIKQRLKECEVSMVAYCLMGNHYHFLLRQNAETEIGVFIQMVFN